MGARLELGPRPWVFGHRGVPSECPENSLQSIRLAIEQGATGVEIDVRLTRDGRLLVAHDRDLGRVAGREDLVVAVSQTALLREAMLLGTAPAEPAPFLEEVLAIAGPDFTVQVELKYDAKGEPGGQRRTQRQRFAAAVARAVGQRRGVLVSSFDLELLHLCREASERLPLAPLAGTPRQLDAAIGAAPHFDAFSLHVADRVARRALRTVQILGLDLPVLVYTVDRAERARRLIAAGAAGLFSDAPGVLRSALRATN